MIVDVDIFGEVLLWYVSFRLIPVLCAFLMIYMVGSWFCVRRSLSISRIFVIARVDFVTNYFSEGCTKNVQA